MDMSIFPSLGQMFGNLGQGFAGSNQGLLGMSGNTIQTGQNVAANIQYQKMMEEQEKKKKAGKLGGIGSTLGALAGTLLAVPTGGASLAAIPAMAAGGAAGGALGGTAGSMLGGGKFDLGNTLGYAAKGGIGGVLGGLGGSALGALGVGGAGAAGAGAAGGAGALGGTVAGMDPLEILILRGMMEGI